MDIKFRWYDLVVILLIILGGSILGVVALGNPRWFQPALLGLLCGYVTYRKQQCQAEESGENLKTNE